MDNINKKLQALYDKYWSLATKVANNVIHDYGWSQDICQEVFVSLYQLVERQELNDDLMTGFNSQHPQLNLQYA